MSEDKTKKDDSENEFSVDDVKNNPDKSFKDILKLRKENEERRLKIEAAEADNKKTADELSKMKAAEKAEADNLLIEQGKQGELIESLQKSNTELTGNNELLTAENSEYKTAAQARAEQLTIDKQAIIDRIKLIDADEANDLTTDLPMKVLQKFEALAKSKTSNNSGAARPNNGEGAGNQAPDFSKMSAVDKHRYKLMNLK